MENVKFEIAHELLLLALAKQLGIEASQIDVIPLTEEEGSAVKAVVRTDLPTANKINAKLKRLTVGGAEKLGDESEDQE